MLDETADGAAVSSSDMVMRRPISHDTIHIFIIQKSPEIPRDVSSVCSVKIYQLNAYIRHLHPWLSLPHFHKDVLQYSLPMISLCVSQDFISVRRGLEFLGVDIPIVHRSPLNNGTARTHNFNITLLSISESI